MTFRSLATVAAMATLSLLGGPVLAETVSTTVRYADLNLDSAAGRDQLTARVAASIRRICGTTDGQTLSVAADVRRCRQSAHSDATLKVAALTSRNADVLLASR